MNRFWRAFKKAELADEIASASAVMLAFLLGVFFANTTDWYGTYILQPSHFSIKALTEQVLMVFFFFQMALEMQKERKVGLLSNRRRVLVPAVAALGGMLVPAGIYVLFNCSNDQTIWGFGIPSATDIVFALCLFDLCAQKLPRSLRVFLLAIALFDDLGAILLIALFYHQGAVDASGLIGVFLGLAGLFGMRRLGSSKWGRWDLLGYGIMGGILAYGLHGLGIHTTLAGVCTGFAIPFHPKTEKRKSFDWALKRVQPWVSFLVLPLFAFTAGGVSFRSLDWSLVWQSPVVWGIAGALFFGKQAGILGASWLCVRMVPLSKLEGTRWAQIYGIAILGGMGFTMSLLIGELAFGDQEALSALMKVGVFLGSALSAAWGLIYFKLLLREKD